MIFLVATRISRSDKVFAHAYCWIFKTFSPQAFRECYLTLTHFNMGDCFASMFQQVSRSECVYVGVGFEF